MTHPIIVVEPKVVETNRIPIHCDYCGERSELIVEVQQVDTQIVYRANLTVCCDEVRERADNMDLSGFEHRERN